MFLEMNLYNSFWRWVYTTVAYCGPLVCNTIKSQLYRFYFQTQSYCSLARKYLTITKIITHPLAWYRISAQLRSISNSTLIYSIHLKFQTRHDHYCHRIFWKIHTNVLCLKYWERHISLQKFCLSRHQYRSFGTRSLILRRIGWLLTESLVASAPHFSTMEQKSWTIFPENTILDTGCPISFNKSQGILLRQEPTQSKYTRTSWSSFSCFKYFNIFRNIRARPATVDKLECFSLGLRRMKELDKSRIKSSDPVFEGLDEYERVW